MTRSLKSEIAPLTEGQALRLLAKYEASGKGWFWETRADGSIAYLSPNIGHVMANDGIYPSSLSELVDSDVDVAERASERSLSFYIASRLPFEGLVLKARCLEELWWSLTGEPSHDAAGRCEVVPVFWTGC